MKAIFTFLFFGALSISVTAQLQERFKKNPSRDTTNTEVSRQNQQVVVEKSTKEPWYKKLRYGGAASASFGTNTAVYLAPNIGYQVSDKFMPGLGFIYLYQKTTIGYNPYTGGVYKIEPAFKTSMYGPAVFTNVYPLEFLQLSGRLEMLNHEIGEYTGQQSHPYVFYRQWSPVLFLGVGYFSRFENGGGFQVGIQYNVLYKGDGTDPYASAWWPTIGFMF